jgi:hypothetical protein
MQVWWNVWTDATSAKSAGDVARRVLREMSRSGIALTFAPYNKTNGWTFAFQTIPTSASWNDAVVETIALGQSMAFDWIIGGDVQQAPESLSTKASVSGVTRIQWQFIIDDMDDMLDQWRITPDESGS